MEKLYVIEAVISTEKGDFRFFWFPPAHCFTFLEARSIIPSSQVISTLAEAEAYARVSFRARGTMYPFTLRAEEVSLNSVRALAAPAPEWMPA